MSTSLRIARLAVYAVLASAALVPGPSAEAAGVLRITNGPRVVTKEPVAGQPVAFTATATFPGEEWIGFQWDWGKGDKTTGITYSSAVTSSPTHTFAEPGRHTVICTAYHGYKSEVFGVGPWKYRMSRSVTVSVAPRLPLTIGVLTIDGDAIEAANKQGTRFRISGNVRVNGGLVLANPAIVDLGDKTVVLSGELTIPAAGEYASGLSFLKNVTLNATTGGFHSADLPDVKAEFEVAGFSAKVENVRVVGSGLELDFEVKIPRLTEDKSDRDDPPEAGAPIDLSKIYPPAPTQKQLAGLSFKKFRIDGVSPHLHALGETKATISNVPFGFAGTKWAIETLEAGVDPSQKRYFGTLKLKLPTDRAVGGTFEIREGQWEKAGFSSDVKLPFWTFTGALDAIYLKSFSASALNLAVLPSEPDRVPVLQAGTFDPISGTVSEPGVVFEWGPSTNLLGQSYLTPIKLTGACTFDPFWNVTAAGQLSFFEDVFGERMRIVGAQGRFAAPQDGRDGGTWYFRGDLVFSPLFSLKGDCTTSFAKDDFYATATATGSTLIPSDHWIAGIVPNLTGTATWMWRLEPDAVNRISFQGHADVPDSYPVLRRVLATKGIAFSYDFATDTYDWGLIDIHTVTGPGKAAVSMGNVTDGAGAGGMVVTLRHATGAGAFSLRLPDGTLLTPADDDDTDVDFVSSATTSMYVLGSAPDGTYSAEFEDSALGAYDVEFFTPLALPTVTVGGPAADTTVGRYQKLDVPFSTSGVASGATVRAYLDDDDAPGGGVLVATGDAGDASLSADVSDAPAGAYRLVVEALGADGMPVAGEAAGRVTVRDHLALAVTRGSLTDVAKAHGDRLTLSGKLLFAGPRPARLFDQKTETLRLTLGGDGAPYVLRVGAGDPAWKAGRGGVLRWKSAKGARPSVALTLDPVRRRFSVSVTRTNFAAAPVNPIHCDLVFGSDSASDTRAWTRKARGRYVR